MIEIKVQEAATQQLNAVMLHFKTSTVLRNHLFYSVMNLHIIAICNKNTVFFAILMVFITL